VEGGAGCEVPELPHPAAMTTVRKRTKQPRKFLNEILPFTVIGKAAVIQPCVYIPASANLSAGSSRPGTAKEEGIVLLHNPARWHWHPTAGDRY